MASSEEESQLSSEELATLCVFGYIRTTASVLGLPDIPSELSSLCVSYYHIMYDTFGSVDSAQIAVSEDGKTITKIKTAWQNTSYGVQPILKEWGGVHRWVLRMDSVKDGVCILGIDEGQSHCDSCFFTDDSKKANYAFYGYDGRKYDHNGAYTDFSSGFEAGDTVEMELDMNRMTLGFGINGKAIKEAFRVVIKKASSYFLAVSLYTEQSVVSIQSYTHRI